MSRRSGHSRETSVYRAFHTWCTGTAIDTRSRQTPSRDGNYVPLVELISLHSLTPSFACTDDNLTDTL